MLSRSASLLCAGLLLCSASAQALTLREAVTAALRGSPTLSTYGYALRAEEARADAAALRPLPTLNVDIENVAGTGEAQGVRAAEASFALSQVLELGNKRRVRMAVADSRRAVVDAERAAAQLDVVAEVGRQYIAVARGQLQLALAHDAVDLARQTVTVVGQRVESARSPEVELARARVELLQTELAARGAEHELATLRVRLAATWGGGAAEVNEVSADLLAVPEPAAFDSLLAKLQDSADWMRFASEARLRDASLRLAEAQLRPDVQFSAGLRRLQVTRDQALVFGFSMPLQSARRANPAVAEALASRGQLEAERQVAQVKARTQLFELHQELLRASDEVSVLGRDVLPQLQRVVQDTEYAYERGRYGYLDLIEAQRAWLEMKRAQIDAAAVARTLQNELERLTGEPMTSDTPEKSP